MIISIIFFYKKIENSKSLTISDKYFFINLCFNCILFNLIMQDFHQGVIDFDNSFDIIKGESQFSSEGKGRIVGISVLPNANGDIPIVRTTTKFPTPPTKFPKCYHNLIDKIRFDTIANLQFNNAMVEVYNNSYCKMGFHTDQSLDLAENSYICLFSSYKNPKAKNIRILHVVNKETGQEAKYPLLHNSYTLFSTETNQKHVHKIVLEEQQKVLDDGEWLGLTMRLSKTYIHFDQNNNPLLPNGNILRIATEDECGVFCKLKGEENSKIGFVYPDIDFTISVSDMMKL